MEFIGYRSPGGWRLTGSVHKRQRRPETVKYRLLSALLLNELQKQAPAVLRTQIERNAALVAVDAIIARTAVIGSLTRLVIGVQAAQVIWPIAAAPRSSACNLPGSSTISQT